MKKWVFLSIIVLLFAPVSSWAIKITDYENPDTFYQEAYLSADFNLQDGNQDQTSYDGAVMAWYDLNYSTLPFTWRFEVDGEYAFTRGSKEEDDTDDGYDVYAWTAADKYYKDTEFLGYASIDYGYRKAMGSEDADDPYVKFGVGVGYGRVIDATALAKAMRCVEDLRKYGVVIQDLSDAAYIELAEVIEREDEYRSKYSSEEYEKYWYEAIEDILKKEGVLKDDALGAMGIIRIQDILTDEPISMRKHGWIVKGGVGYIASNYDGSDSDPSIDAQFEYAIPYTYRLQIIELFKYSTILEDDPVHQFQNELSLTYEISNRIDWMNVWTATVTLPTEDEAEDIITNNFSSKFLYYIANKIWADFTITFNHIDDNVDDNGNDDLETRISFGLTYRLR